LTPVCFDYRNLRVKIHQRIKKRRKALGVSQRLLASTLNKSITTISTWENGHTVPSTDELLGLARYLNVSVDWLLSGREFKSDPGAPAPPAAERKARKRKFDV
jgi:transcriptional regulator with XRE-family HTH domain